MAYLKLQNRQKNFDQNRKTAMKKICENRNTAHVSDQTSENNFTKTKKLQLLIQIDKNFKTENPSATLLRVYEKLGHSLS